MEQQAHYGLLQIALEAAVSASVEIMRVYRLGFSPVFKKDGSPVTEADLASNRAIEKILSVTGIPFLSEESQQEAYEHRRQWQHLWCVDPLDGTKEFIRRNDEFAVNIALIENGKPVLGLIASPVNQQILIGGTQVPAALVPFTETGNPENWHYIERRRQPNAPIVIAGSRTPHSGATLKFINDLKERFGDCAFLKKGSALKFFDLATGTADIYPRFAPTMEWDIAAGQAIMESLGGNVVHAITGEPLHYNKANLQNPYFVVNTHAIRQQLTADA